MTSASSGARTAAPGRTTHGGVGGSGSTGRAYAALVEEGAVRHPVSPLAGQMARALGSPFLPGVLEELGGAGDYLACVWPQLEPSVATQGFLNSALYMADMASDGIEESYEPELSREALLAGGITSAELERLLAVLDVFQWLQPQLLLLLSALAEAWDDPVVGGRGRPEPRESGERARAHLATEILLAPPVEPPLADVARAIGLQAPPELYRAVARWPRYLDQLVLPLGQLEELEHLAAYPPIRRRGRALYFYARSSTRFLAHPLRASRAELRARGVSSASLDQARTVIDASLPALSTMMMHLAAMRWGLGVRDREVVKRA